MIRNKKQVLIYRGRKDGKKKKRKDKGEDNDEELPPPPKPGKPCIIIGQSPQCWIACRRHSYSCMKYYNGSYPSIMYGMIGFMIFILLDDHLQ